MNAQPERGKKGKGKASLLHGTRHDVGNARAATVILSAEPAGGASYNAEIPPPARGRGVLAICRKVRPSSLLSCSLSLR
ncbi:MAG TPA: hypothetical protein VEI03_09675 [Stellaceae bacterium]|nr:hypothetical protein [Stellaceae bacterium]